MTRKVIISLFVIILFITSCRYKEGPMISFRSVEKRITGRWQVIAFTSDGVDSLQYYNDSCGSKVTIQSPFYEDGTRNNDALLSFSGGKKIFQGRYTLDDSKKHMDVYIANSWNLGPVGGGSSNWKILKLTMYELKISTDFNGRNYIISFKR